MFIKFDIENAYATVLLIMYFTAFYVVVIPLGLVLSFISLIVLYWIYKVILYYFYYF